MSWARLRTCLVSLWGACQRGPCWAHLGTTEDTPVCGISPAPGQVLLLICHVLWASRSLHDLACHIVLACGGQWGAYPHSTQDADRTKHGMSCVVPTQSCKDVLISTGCPPPGGSGLEEHCSTEATVQMEIFFLALFKEAATGPR